MYTIPRSTHCLITNADDSNFKRKYNHDTVEEALTFLKSSVHLRVGEKLEGEVTWPWQTGQHFTQTLMQHGTHTSPHTAEKERGREVSSQT